MKRTLHCALSGTALLVTALTLSAGETKSVANQLGTEQRPVFVQQVAPKPTESELRAAEAHRRAEEAQARDKTTRDNELVLLTARLATYTGFLFLATISLAFVTLGLVIVGYRQVSEARKSTAAAVQIANAAMRSAAASEAALTTLERPWLIHYSHVAQRAPMGWSIVFTFQNAGRSPAVVTGCLLTIVEEAASLPDIPDYAKTLPIGIDRQTVPAGESTSTRPLGRDFLDSAARFRVYGRLDYEQLGGQAHQTGFSVEVHADPQAGGVVVMSRKTTAYDYVA